EDSPSCPCSVGWLWCVSFGVAVNHRSVDVSLFPGSGKEPAFGLSPAKDRSHVSRSRAHLIANGASNISGSSLIPKSEHVASLYSRLSPADRRYAAKIKGLQKSKRQSLGKVCHEF